ncbi:unnamed protein product [Rotaria sordida]|uniref:Uncharacterized protein n=1 Tax=Rotaria sordida TaxID=392033 RepID=A0A814SPZ7_9BILA|nr:unnamed protein product [Rotaria sordida]
MALYHSFSSLELDNGDSAALDWVALISMPNLEDFSSVDQAVDLIKTDFFEDPNRKAAEEHFLSTMNPQDQISMIYFDELFQTEENYGQDSSELSNIEEAPTAETHALNQDPHESLLRRQLLMGQTDEDGQIKYSLTINQILLGSTEVEDNPTDDNPSTPTFLESDYSVSISNGESIEVSVPPCPYQRARYEDECLDANRYIFVPWNKSLTITIPDLRLRLPARVTVYLRITRITQKHNTSDLTFLHPYPIWIRHDHVKVHGNSLFIPVTERDFKNGCIKIENLAMLRLRQPNLAKMKTLAIYSPTQLTFTDLHPTGTNGAKETRDQYNLRQSILTFQLVLVDENNMAYCTDTICETEGINEYDATETKNLRHILDTYGAPKRIRSPMKNKKIGELKKPRAITSQRNQDVTDRYTNV